MRPHRQVLAALAALPLTAMFAVADIAAQTRGAGANDRREGEVLRRVPEASPGAASPDRHERSIERPRIREPGRLETPELRAVPAAPAIGRGMEVNALPDPCQMGLASSECGDKK
jgi:hypothetical protein